RRMSCPSLVCRGPSPRARSTARRRSGVRHGGMSATPPADDIVLFHLGLDCRGFRPPPYSRDGRTTAAVASRAPMAQRSPLPARPAAIPAGSELRLHRLLRLPEAPFAALAVPCGDGQFLAGLTAGSPAIRYGLEPPRPGAHPAARRLPPVLV